MRKNSFLKAVVIEIFFILVLIASYNIFLNFFSNKYSIIISSIISLAINFISYYFIIYKQNINVKKVFQYLFASIICFLFYKLINDFLYDGNDNIILISKFLKIILVLFFNVCIKLPLFCKDNKYGDSFINIFKNLDYNFKKIINSKYLIKVFKFLPHNIFLFFSFVFILIYLVLFINSNSNYLIYSKIDYSKNIGPLINKSVVLEFNDIENDTKKSDIVNKICIPFGTYIRKNNSILKFELTKDNNIFFSKKINTSILKDGKLYCLKINNVKVKNLKIMNLKITSSKANKSNNITIFKSKNSKIGFSLFNSNSNFSFKYILIIVYGIVFLIINYIINRYKNVKTHNYFLLILVYIVPIAFIYPPLEIPDEPTHFKLSYMFSQNGLTGINKDSINVPKNIECLNYSKIEDRDKVNDTNDIKKCFTSKKNKNVNVLFGSNSKIGFSFLGYIFSALFVKIIDFFVNSPMIIFYFGRIGNLVFSLFIIYKSLKIAPRYNRILLFIVSIPMFIQQMCSYSYDSPLNSLSILLVSYFLAIMDNKIDLNIKLKIKLFIIMLFLLSVKMIYLPLIVLLFLIPSEKYGGIKKKVTYFITIITGLLCFYFLINNIFISSADAIISSSNESNLSYLLSSPLSLFGIAYNTIKINGIFYVTSLFGHFSWFKFQLNGFSIVLYLIFMFYLFFGEESCLKKIRKNKVLIMFSILIMVAAIFASMYLFWSTYKLGYVDGVQGRYFIPLLGLFSLLIIPKKQRYKVDNNILYSFINIMLFQYIVSLIAFFY